MTIVAGLFASVFGRLLGRRKGTMTAVVGIGVYTVLVGANAAVVRAAILGGLSLFARQVGRRQHGLNSLAIVAAVMAPFDPDVLWDVGFQLSFMATLGLVLYAEPLTQAFQCLVASRWSLVPTKRIAPHVSEYCLFTLAAQLTTLPVTIYHFGRLSLVSLLANPFILHAQPMVMILGGLAALLELDLDSACGERLRPGQPAGMDRKDASGVVLLSVAAGDSRGLPDAETLQAVRGYSVLRTDMNGWIEITTDGEWK